MELVIGNKNYSSWSLRPWLLLTHFKVPFEEVFIPLATSETPRLLAKHCPAKKVPVLYDGNLIVWDSLSICEYISEHYLQGKGYPADNKQRAVARSLVAEMHSGFPMIRQYMAMDVRGRGKTYDVNHVELAKEIERVEEIFSGKYAVDGAPFLMGEFGIVDCMYAPIALRFRCFFVELSSTAQDYMNQLLALFAMQSWQNAANLEKAVIDLP